MRLRTHAPTSTRTARNRVVVAAVLSTAGLAALPVAAEVAEDEPELGSSLPAVEAIGAVEAAPDTVGAEAEGSDATEATDLGLDRWYTPEEVDDLTPEPETVEVTAEDEEDAEPAEEPVDAGADEAPAERSKWDRLAECESGEWVNGGESFIEGSARWDYGISFTHEGYEQFQGGLNFEPGTWDAFRDPDMPDHAGNATREQEIVVGERVLAEQGWQAWPRCSKMVGLR
jgi:hypothetical protein